MSGALLEVTVTISSQNVCNKMPVQRISTELLERFRSPQLFWMVLGMIATSTGMLGGFPQPPRIFLSTVERYPILQWGLVYVLIYQGMGGADNYWSLIGVIATYVVYKVISYFEGDEEKPPAAPVATIPATPSQRESPSGAVFPRSVDAAYVQHLS